MISEGFIRYATINKRRYSFIKKLMVFDKTYESFVRASYNGRHGLRGLNNSHDQLKIIFYKEITTQTYEIFKQNQQSRNSSTSVQLSQSSIRSRGIGPSKILEDINSKFLQEFESSNRAQCLSTGNAYSETCDSINGGPNNSDSASFDEQCRKIIETEGQFNGTSEERARAREILAELEQRCADRDRELERLAREIAQGKRDIEAIDARNRAFNEEAARRVAREQAETYIELMKGQRDTWIHYGNVEAALACGKPIASVAEFYRYLSNKPRKKWGKKDTHAWNIITDWYARNRVEKVKLPSVGSDNDDIITIDV